MNLESTLLERAHSKCELCSATSALSVYNIPPVKTISADNSILLCGTCRGQIENPATIDPDHWRCLNDRMWSEFPAVQAMAWRILKKLTDHDWARDMLDQLFLEEEVQNWAEAFINDAEVSDKGV